MLSERTIYTATALGGAAVYTSPVFPVDDASAIEVSCYADQDGSLVVQQSHDGTNFDIVDTIPYTAAAKERIEVNVTGLWAQLVYTNGAVAQTAFRLSAAKKKSASSDALDIAAVKTATGLTTFGQETVVAMDVNGTTWKDLLDNSAVGLYTEIWGITVTKGGAWAGNAKLRIVTGAGTKIFPFATEAVEGTDFIDATAWPFPAPVCVPASEGYKVQFRSSNAADGAGETLALTELAVITRS